jgi:hypothetical protein
MRICCTSKLALTSPVVLSYACPSMTRREVDVFSSLKSPLTYTQQSGLFNMTGNAEHQSLTQLKHSFEQILNHLINNLQPFILDNSSAVGWILSRDCMLFTMLFILRLVCCSRAFVLCTTIVTCLCCITVVTIQISP